GVEHHPLPLADRDHGLANPLQIADRDRALIEIPLQLRIADGRVAAGAESVRNREHDVSPLLDILEQTRAISEAALLVRQLGDRLRRAIPHLHARDRLAHILSIRADVLNGSCAREARNAGEALDAGETATHGVRDGVIPRFARRNMQQAIALFDASQLDADDETVEASIGDQQIAAAAEDEDALRLARGPCERV